jgi:hypothetical protein
MRTFMMAAAVAATMASAPAISQVGAGNLVNVQIGNIDILRNSLNNNDVRVLNNFLNDPNVNAQLPITVQVPVGVAANVCPQTAVALLADLKADGTATCTANSASRAMSNSIVRAVQNQ